jgi:hypothetical protein
MCWITVVEPKVRYGATGSEIQRFDLPSQSYNHNKQMADACHSSSFPTAQAYTDRTVLIQRKASTRPRTPGTNTQDPSQQYSSGRIFGLTRQRCITTPASGKSGGCVSSTWLPYRPCSGNYLVNVLVIELRLG